MSDPVFNLEIELEIKRRIRLTLLFLGAPLTLVFWIADRQYIPEFQWEALLFRFLAASMLILIAFNLRQFKSLKKAYGLVLISVIVVTLPVQILILLQDDVATPYISGLHMISIAALTFYPMPNPYFIATCLIIYMPYFVVLAMKPIQSNSIGIVVVYLMNSLCFLTIAYVLKVIQEKMREKEFLARQKLESEIKLRETLYRQVSRQVVHDIRSPITAFKMIAESIKSENPDRGVLLARAVDRIEHITGDIQNIAKREAEELYRNDIEPVDKIRILDCLLTIAKEKESEYSIDNLKVEVTCSVNRNTRAYAQKSVFERIISNLLNNSKEASKDGSKVYIELREATQDELKELEGSNYIAITISDEGRGIPEEILEKLGKEGYSYNKSGGSGLGLYHAKTALKRWGGELRIKSELQQGTKITLFLRV
ncbi:MAG: hypothetical protein COT74_03275 [Bdellovibrionales bacterium CG10_big_fil_rev_8_21_14_0_10_45_34]|nr:MAG: hypothetical protein COT74_03275 [Bdellovibrionales bacterium CG10_big_fil_rev_8_21_14_0_10_45_34]